MQIGEAFKYCLRCGSKAELIQKRLHCPACGLDFYLNPKPVQEIALQNDKGEFLFTVRGAEPRKGYLDFPGGFVDDEENFDEAIRRELKEELGIEVGELTYLGTNKESYPFQGINYHTCGVAYYAKLPPAARLKPGDDVVGFEFYRLEDVPRERLAWPSDLLVLDWLAKLKKSASRPF